MLPQPSFIPTLLFFYSVPLLFSLPRSSSPPHSPAPSIPLPFSLPRSPSPISSPLYPLMLSFFSPLPFFSPPPFFFLPIWGPCCPFLLRPPVKLHSMSQGPPFPCMNRTPPSPASSQYPSFKPIYSPPSPLSPLSPWCYFSLRLPSSPPPYRLISPCTVALATN